jgi:predicted metallo-beta-lactamase superfamily hydrolase
MILSIYYKNRTWTSTQKNITKVVLKALKTLIMTAHTLKTRDWNIDL